MAMNIHRYSLLIPHTTYFLPLITLKTLSFKGHYFFNQSSCTPNGGFMLQQWLQVQRRQIFCPHPWRTVDSLKIMPRPCANHPNRSSCWPHSPGDKHKLCSCCCPNSHPQNHIQASEITGSVSLLQQWQVIVKEMCAVDAAQAAGVKLKSAQANM